MSGPFQTSSIIYVFVKTGSVFQHVFYMSKIPFWQTEMKESFTHWSTSQRPASGGAGPGQRQSDTLNLDLPHGCQTPKERSCPALLPRRVHTSRKLAGSRRGLPNQVAAQPSCHRLFYSFSHPHWIVTQAQVNWQQHFFIKSTDA